MTVTITKPTAVTFYDLLQKNDINAVREVILDLPPEQLLDLNYDWEFWARPKQRTPNWDWFIWMLKSGRGTGKTRVGAEFTRAKSKTTERIHLIGRTAADVRDTMVLGESGILAISPPWWKPKYRSSVRRIEWPNGASALCFSADEPDLLRGPQCGAGWADEVAAWKYAEEAWNNFMFGLRLGDNPQACVTTTPRPIPLVKALVARAGKDVHVTTESTYDNAMNLAPQFLEMIIGQYENTRLGRQEIHGEVLDDNPYALWKIADIEKNRVAKAPQLDRIVVGVDPQSHEPEDIDKMLRGKEERSVTGIVVDGIVGRKGDHSSHLYTLADCTINGTPRQWGQAAVDAYYKHEADAIVVEINNGGAMVKANIQSIDSNVKIIEVRASRGKRTRAEPIASIYEQGRGHHVGMFPELEDEMTQWVPGEDSPDRMDAHVWAATELMLGEKQARIQVLA